MSSTRRREQVFGREGLSPRGFVHSLETAGTVDGPGIRFVVFLQGCHLRCQYCHNPDTWPLDAGETMTPAGLLDRIEPYARFLQRYGGGVTLTGGEPLIQIDFVREVVGLCRARGLHVAIDTNGFLGERVGRELLERVHLWILDVKSHDAATHKRVTAVDNAKILAFAKRLAQHGKALWIRFVVVPGLTDDEDNVRGLAAFVAGLDRVDRVELLPYHDLGAFKWRALGLEYPLEGTPSAGESAVARVRAIFADHGITAC